LLNLDVSISEVCNSGIIMDYIFNMMKHKIYSYFNASGLALGFKAFIRNFTRKPVNNLINLIGLSVSLALVIILSVYCYSELTTDKFHKNGDCVYLYGLEDHFYTPGVMKEHIDNKVPGVEATVRIGGTWEAPVFRRKVRNQ
jgi:hypothetical protein